MLTVTKPVYYCSHCKRHRLTKAPIEKHEPRCIYNPERTVCGWHEQPYTIPAPADFTEALKKNLDVEWLRKEMDGCPACMLAVVVQADLTFEERDDLAFDYKAEIARFRDQERQEQYADVAW
jgi:hypothetical protein